MRPREINIVVIIIYNIGHIMTWVFPMVFLYNAEYNLTYLFMIYKRYISFRI